MDSSSNLLQKYSRPVPRYTSYPTVPFWKENIDAGCWKEDFKESFHICNKEEGISLYLHLPFCESLCIYCGCNKKITRNHAVEEEYLQAVVREWRLYLGLMEQAPLIREIHLGGGTPTFFSPANLERLIAAILEDSFVHRDHSFSLEGHPNNTTREHLDRLYAVGFRRISLGVQDLNEEVQQIIRRIQPFENLRRATEDARAAGFTAINFDLIYGLPRQTPDRLRNSILRSVSLRPDRLAFYSYAHTPQLMPSQRLIDDKDLPSASEKLQLYELGKALLAEQGYTNIGMDHFALPGDELYTAWQEGRLHRNFMGYTTRQSRLLLGLGLSAISDTGTAFAQNEKPLANYYQAIAHEELPISKGYFLTAEDNVFRRHILDISCNGRTLFDPAWTPVLEQWTLPMLRELEKDGLVTLDAKGVALTEAGGPFLRHCCKAFDLHLLRNGQAGAAGAIGNSPRGDTAPGSGMHPLFSNAI